MPAVIVGAIPVHGSHAKMQPAITVTAIPVHGSHAKVKESINEAIREMPSSDLKNFHLKQSHSDEHWDHLNTSYKKHPEDFGHDNVHASITSYTKSSPINRHLVNLSTGNDKSILNSTSKEYNVGTNLYDEDKHKKVVAKFKTQIRHLDHAIEHCPLKTKAIVYHGAGFNPHSFALQHPDRQIHLPAYTSTSANPAVAKAFSNNYNDAGENKK